MNSAAKISLLLRRFFSWRTFIACALTLSISPFTLSFAYQGSSSASEVQLFGQAQELTSEGRFRDAAEIYDKIVRLDPGSFEAFNNLGVIESHLGDYRKAALAYERALALRPGSFPVLMNLGIVYFKEKDFTSAVKPLARAVALEPANFQARALLALTEYSAKDFRAACQNLEKALALQPGNATLEYMLGESYLRTGQEQKLLNAFEKVASQPSATDYMLMGAAYDGLGQVDQAIRQFESAARANPNALDVHFGLGYLYWKKHDDLRAAGEFQREMEDAGWVAASEAYLGDLDVRHDKGREARAMLKQALSLKPDLSLAHADLGTLDAREKNYTQAAVEFERAIQFAPDVADNYSRLARVYAAEGKSQAAAAERAKAASLPSVHERELAQEAARIPPPE